MGVDTQDSEDCKEGDVNGSTKDDSEKSTERDVEDGGMEGKDCINDDFDVGCSEDGSRDNSEGSKEDNVEGDHCNVGHVKGDDNKTEDDVICKDTDKWFDDCGNGDSEGRKNRGSC